MKVPELIKVLKLMPSNAKVYHLWDGEARTEIKHVYLARSGNVITADDRQVAYCNEDRPISAPTSDEDQYWETPIDNDL